MIITQLIWERPASTPVWEITCVTFSDERFIFTHIGTQMVLKKTDLHGNGGFLYKAIFIFRKVESKYDQIFFINI